MSFSDTLTVYESIIGMDERSVYRYNGQRKRLFLNISKQEVMVCSDGSDIQSYL